MECRGGGAADKYRYCDACLAQTLRYVAHLVERRGYKAAQTDEVDLAGKGLLDDLLRGNHHTEISHLEIVAREHYTCDILPDVVHVALDGGYKELSGRVRWRCAARKLYVRAQYLDGAFHRAGRLDYLRQEHLARPEEFADMCHAAHERALDNVGRCGIGCKGLMKVGIEIFVVAAFECVGNTLLKRYCRAVDGRVGLFRRSVLSVEACGHGHEPLCGIVPAAENDILQSLEQVGRYVAVHDLR